MSEIRTLDLLKNFNGAFNPLVEEADEQSDRGVSICQRTEFVVADLWNSCKSEGVKIAREEETMIDLFPDNTRPSVMISDKELRRRGSRLVLPEHVRAKMEELGGVDPVLVITKFVTKTDVSKQHVRLSLPLKQLEEGLRGDRRFLTEAEWERVKAKEGDITNAMLVGPKCSEPTEVSLKSWSSPEGLVIANGWGGFLAKYNKHHCGLVEERDAVQVWAARCNGGRDVLLALVVVGYNVDTTLHL